jgi:hypothetical protein
LSSFIVTAAADVGDFEFDGLHVCRGHRVGAAAQRASSMDYKRFTSKPCSVAK